MNEQLAGWLAATIIGTGVGLLNFGIGGIVHGLMYLRYTRIKGYYSWAAHREAEGPSGFFFVILGFFPLAIGLSCGVVSLGMWLYQLMIGGAA